MCSQQIEYQYSSDQVAHPMPYSWFAEWLVFFLMIFVLLESVFFNYLEGYITERSIWWARITPWNLYPTELFFFVFFLIPGFFITLFGRKYGYRTSRGIGLFVAIFSVGTLAALYGYAAGGRSNLWLDDYRQLFLMIIFAPIFCTLAPGIRLHKLADRLCSAGVILAIYSGTIGVLVFSGVITRESPWSSGQWSEQVLILLYLFVLIKMIITGKNHVFKLMIFAFGILAPLDKTPMASFIVLHVVAIYILLIWVKYQKLYISLRTIKALLILGILFFASMPWFLSLGDGAARRWLAYRWLKEDTPAGDVTSGRMDAWNWGLSQWKGSPLIGTGLGHRRAIMSRAGEVRFLHVHNIAISLLYQTGIVGFAICFLAFIAWFVRIKRYIINCRDELLLWPVLAMFIFCITILIASLAGQSIGIPYVGFAFWICIAFVSDAEAQNYMSIIYGDQHNIDTTEYDEYEMYVNVSGEQNV